MRAAKKGSKKSLGRKSKKGAKGKEGCRGLLNVACPATKLLDAGANHALTRDQKTTEVGRT